MAELIVSGAFAITKGSLGGGASEFWVVVSITHADGKPIDLSFAATDVDPGPIVIAIALSVGFGATFIPLHIEEIKDKNNSSFPAGFYALRVETQKWGDLEVIGVKTIAIIVTTGKDHGQALACSCAPAKKEETAGKLL